jgi:signal transduction histidine kinase
MKLNQLSDFFIPDNYSLSNDQKTTQRIIVWVILISAITDLLKTNLAYSMKTYEILYLLLANAAISIILLFIFKSGVSKHILLNVFIAQHAASFALQAWYQGGLISPANASFFLLPAVAMLTLGKKSAFVWLMITSLILVSFYVFRDDFGIPAKVLSIDEKGYLFFNGVLFTNITIFIILIVYENQKNKAIHELNEINEDLVQTQEQLIHSEKMASLGELTAGIAHEIQNPLNFVNNFSDLNKELLEELIEELENGNSEDVKELSENLIENERKILFHGKRAEGIVKSMLQHSRGGEGKKELTDINELCDEYLR